MGRTSSGIACGCSAGLEVTVDVRLEDHIESSMLCVDYAERHLASCFRLAGKLHGECSPVQVIP